MHYPLKLSQTMEVETFGEKQANPELSPLRDDQLSDFNDLFQFDDPQNEPPHKLASEGQSHTKQAPKPKQEDVLPTLAQIQRCMGLVAGLMPEMFPPKVVHLFYNKLMQKFADSPILVPETSKPDRSDSVKIENGFEHMPADQSVAVTQYSNELSQYNNSFLGHPKEKRQALTQAELQQRKLLRTVVAQSFCKGKGYEGAKTELSKRHLHSSFNSTIHDQILEQLLLSTQQYVQKLVTDGYCIKGARIVAAQVKSIQRVMAGCRYVLSPQICQIIFKAVEEYCSQGVILMSKEEGMRMLKGINQGLKKSPRVFTKPKSEITRQFEQKRRQRVNKEESESNAKKSKFELHRVWNSDFEDILLEMCRAGVQFVQIRQRFLQSYPNQKDLFTITALRSMFFKIIRMSVRRLLKEYQQKRDTLPHLCKMEDQLVKNIINCSQTAAIRRMLIEVYTSQTCGKRKLSEVIVMINRYAENGGALKKSVAISMNDDQE